MQQKSMIEMPPEEPMTGELRLSYAGMATHDHSIDAEHYARSVLGFGKVFKKINRNIIGLDVSISLRAERPGSFEALVEFLSKKEVVAAAVGISLLQFFGLDFKTICMLPINILRLIVNVIKESKGNSRRIREAIKELGLPEAMEKKLIRLVENKDFRRSLDDMTLFLQLQGMDSITVKQKNTQSAIIEKKDRPYFVAQPEDEISVEQDEKVVSITYLSPEKSKWEFKSKNLEFWAQVEDDIFLEEMRDKALEDIMDLQFVATVEKTTIKKARTKQAKVTTSISGFKRYENPTQLNFLK